MTDYDILDQYAKVKFHFDGIHRYEKDFHLPKKNIETFSKYIDMKYWLNENNFNKMTLFFIWLFYTKQNNYDKSKTSIDVKGDEFKEFVSGLKNYNVSLENDFVKLYNAKDFEKIKKMVFKKEINPISFWLLANTVYKSKLPEIKESSVFKNIWTSATCLADFIKFDKEYLKSYVERFKN